MTTWLRPNKRALALGMIPPGAAVLAGVVLLSMESDFTRVAGSLAIALGLPLGALIAWQMCLPRLAYQDGHMLVYLRTSQPIRIPIDIVECFLLGQAPTMLPGKQHEHAETASVVIRLSETATDWIQRDVNPALGKWCEGYITLRGTWCEPLDVNVVYRLNAQLAQAKESLRQSRVAS